MRRLAMLFIVGMFVMGCSGTPTRPPATPTSVAKQTIVIVRETVVVKQAEKTATPPKAPTATPTAPTATPTVALLRIWVEFPADFQMTGLTQEEVMTRLQSEFESAFAGRMKVAVEERTFMRSFQESVENIRKEVKLDDLWQRVHELGLRDPATQTESKALSQELRQAMDAYEAAAARFDKEMASRGNLAKLPPGHVGFFFTLADGYGSTTLPGEHWSKVYTGQLKLHFPNDRAAQLTYLVGAAKEGLGRQFGLDYTRDFEKLVPQLSTWVRGGQP